MGNKYYVWNFDDGLEQDKKIIEILKKYHMDATFNLNSGLYGDKTYEGRIGNLGMTEMPKEKYEMKKRHLLPYVPHFRIPEDEVVKVYEGFEIASHTLTHRNLPKCSVIERQRQVYQDVRNLKEKFNQDIVGFAYPYGSSSEECEVILKNAGIKYARTVHSDQSFRFPKNPLRMPMTCWHISKKVFPILEEFYELKAEEDLLFVMFAHGYEFDFNTKESNWEKFEKICQSVTANHDIICCSTRDAFQMHEGR